MTSRLVQQSPQGTAASILWWSDIKIADAALARQQNTSTTTLSLYCKLMYSKLHFTYDQLSKIKRVL
jgi:hypothetical protein